MSHAIPPTSTVALFGASSRTGAPLLDELLQRGYTVRAQARTPSKIGKTHERLTVLQGDYKNATDVARVLDGADAAITLVGHVKGSEPNLLVTGAQNVIEGMRVRGLRRLIVLTGAGVPNERDTPGFADKAIRFIMNTFFKDMIRDATASTEATRASGLDYTVVRGPRLTDGAPKGTRTVGYVGEINTAITRADLAKFIAEVLEEGTHVGDEPAVSN